MRFLYLLFAAILPCTTLLAQQRFVPATVYLPAGDSLTGEMDYRKWDVNPQSVSFRQNGAVTSYTAEMITGFRIHENDETYAALPGDLDVTHEIIEQLIAEKARKIDSGKHFFRRVLNGPIELFQLSDRNMRQHLAIRDKDTVLHLIRESRIIDKPGSENNGKLQVLNHYRQQLDMYMYGCNKKFFVDNLEYRAEAISRLLIRYLACKSPGTVVAAQKKDPQMRAMWGVLAGASLNTFQGKGDHPVIRNKLKSSATPVFGIFMDAPLSRRRQQFALNFELVYDNRKLTSGGPDKIDVNFHYMSLQTLFRYTYPVGELRPYVNGGVGIMAKLGKGTDEFLREGWTTKQDALGGGRSILLPMVVGTGLRYKRLNGEVRMILPHILEDYTHMNVKATTFQLLVRYAIFR